MIKQMWQKRKVRKYAAKFEIDPRLFSRLYKPDHVHLSDGDLVARMIFNVYGWQREIFVVSNGYLVNIVTGYRMEVNVLKYIDTPDGVIDSEYGAMTYFRYIGTTACRFNNLPCTLTSCNPIYD